MAEKEAWQQEAESLARLIAAEPSSDARDAAKKRADYTNRLAYLLNHWVVQECRKSRGDFEDYNWFFQDAFSETLNNYEQGKTKEFVPAFQRRFNKKRKGALASQLKEESPQETKASNAYIRQSLRQIASDAGMESKQITEELRKIRNMKNLKKVHAFLESLGYDESELDSVYDVGVSGAVSRFQKVYGYKVTGEASPEVQKAIDYEAGRLRQTFDGATYDFKENADQQLVQLVYTSPEDGRVYTVGCTAQDVLAGARKPSEVFAEYLAANEQTTDISQLVNYATVDTHGQALSLNLRAEPNAESDVLAMVEDGASLRVERQYAEWTQVRYGGAEGYLMNAYLRFWTGPEDAIPSGEDQAAADAAAQVDYATAKASAGVYDDNTDAAELLGRLPKGTQVEVLEMDDSWCLIQYKGHQGWALREDLQLVMLEDAQS